MTVKIETDPSVRQTQIRKAQAFASQVSRKIADAGYGVLACKDSKTLEGIRISGTLAPRTQLPQAKIWLDFDQTPVQLLPLREKLVESLRNSTKYWVSELGDDWILVAPKRIAVVAIPSSDGVTTYRVRLENETPVMCNCMGFMYRLTCRHLAESLTVNTEKFPV